MTNAGDMVTLKCGTKDHECNDIAIVFKTKSGERHYFDNKRAADSWYDENFKEVTTGSVACSICGTAAIDRSLMEGF